MSDLRKTAEEIFGMVPEPDFWGGWMLQEIRMGADECEWPDISIEVDLWKEILVENADWSADGIEQIEWLLSIMPRFKEMLTEPVRRGPEDFGEYAQWVTQEYIDDQMHWAYAQKQGSGRRPTNEGRNFLKHWLRFIWHYTGHGPEMMPMGGWGGNKTPQDALNAMTPAIRLGFLTARTLFPELNHKDVWQVRKDNTKNVHWSVDPNG